MSKNELERMTRRYAAEIQPIIGPELDIPAPDMYTDAQTMASRVAELYRGCLETSDPDAIARFDGCSSRAWSHWQATGSRSSRSRIS